MKSHSKPYDTVLDAIGWTPLIRLTRVVGNLRTSIYGKAEFYNPGGSVKDRIGVAIVEAAEESGELKPGGTIVEGTSGNTGIGLAIAAALKGYRCIFTMPDKMSNEKVQLLRAFGAEVIITPTAVPPDHPDNYVMKAKQIVKDTPNSIFANQFFNQINPEAHYRTTGPEIWEQTEGRVTHFIASVGTGGTISGVGKYLKEKNPDIKVVAADPVGSIYAGTSRNEENIEGHPYKVEGVGGDKIPTTLHFEYIDEFVTVSDADSFQMARRITREEGLFVGGSSGMNVCVALELATRLDDPKAMIVTILPSTGERYLSKIYNDAWMLENQMMEAERVSAAALLKRKQADQKEIVTVAPSATIRQAINLMSTYNVSQLPVIANGDCVGSVSEGVLMAQAISDGSLLDRQVSEKMEAPYPVVDADTTVEKLTDLLSRESPAALVRESGELTGIITRFDILRIAAGLR